MRVIGAHSTWIAHPRWVGFISGEREGQFMISLNMVCHSIFLYEFNALSRSYLAPPAFRITLAEVEPCNQPEPPPIMSAPVRANEKLYI